MVAPNGMAASARHTRFWNGVPSGASAKVEALACTREVFGKLRSRLRERLRARLVVRRSSGGTAWYFCPTKYRPVSAWPSDVSRTRPSGLSVYV